jgi:DnaJ-class molecular chaperone
MICKSCNGYGYEVDVIEGNDGEPPTVYKSACPVCGGTGWIRS